MKWIKRNGAEVGVAIFLLLILIVIMVGNHLTAHAQNSGAIGHGVQDTMEHALQWQKPDPAHAQQPKTSIIDNQGKMDHTTVTMPSSGLCQQWDGKHMKDVICPEWVSHEQLGPWIEQHCVAVPASMSDVSKPWRIRCDQK